MQRKKFKWLGTKMLTSFFTLISGTVDVISLLPSLYSLNMTQDSYCMHNSNDGGWGQLCERPDMWEALLLSPALQKQKK